MKGVVLPPFDAASAPAYIDLIDKLVDADTTHADALELSALLRASLVPMQEARSLRHDERLSQYHFGASTAFPAKNVFVTEQEAWKFLAGHVRGFDSVPLTASVYRRGFCGATRVYATIVPQRDDSGRPSPFVYERIDYMFFPGTAPDFSHTFDRVAHFDELVLDSLAGYTLRDILPAKDTNYTITFLHADNASSEDVTMTQKGGTFTSADGAVQLVAARGLLKVRKDHTMPSRRLPLQIPPMPNKLVWTFVKPGEEPFVWTSTRTNGSTYVMSNSEFKYVGYATLGYTKRLHTFDPDVTRISALWADGRHPLFALYERARTLPPFSSVAQLFAAM